MTDQTPDDGALHALADVLDTAAGDRAADVARLADLEPDQLDYLAHVDELEDPATDGLEGRCV